MQLTLLSPAENAIIQPYAPFVISINIKNLGPDTLFPGDTVFYNLPTQLLIDYSSYVLTQSMPPGNSAVLSLDTLINDDSINTTTDFCVRVRSSYGGHGTFIDSVISNNSDCNEVSFVSVNGINEIAKGREMFSISPNPAVGQIKVALKGEDLYPYSLLIRSVDGRILKKITPQRNQTNLVIPISGLAPGLYFLEAIGEKGHGVQKFIKQ